MNLLKSKKADTQHELYEVLIQVILIASAFGLLTWDVYSRIDDTLFEKIHLSRDIALASETIFASPHNVQYDYTSPKLSKFNYTFSNQLIGVGEGPATPIKFPYAQDLFFTINLPKLIRPEKIEFANSDNIINTQKINLNYLKYPSIDHTLKNIHLISGIITNPATGQDYADDEPFVKLIILTDIGTTRETRKLIQKTTPEARFNQTSDIASDMVLIFNNNSAQPQTFKIYIPSNPAVIKQSRKLASLIINQLSDIETFKKINMIIVPVKANPISPTIAVEIGNELIIKSNLEIVTTISNATREY